MSSAESTEAQAHSDAIDILNIVRSVLVRVQQLRDPSQSKAQPDYVGTLRDLTDVLSNASSAVRYLLNSATSMNSLPPELLARIFSSYAIDEVRHGPCSFRPFRIPSARATVRLTEVCKHWRDVALSTATLWSGIICGGRDRTPFERYLHLSRSSALHLIVNGDVETVGELFRDQPSRVRHLLLLDISENWSRRRDPRDLLSAVAPDLLACTLDLRFWPRAGLPELSYLLFAGKAQDLRELVIQNTRVIPLDDFPNLTHLLLHGILGIPSVTHILDLLRRCPRLEEVCIHSIRDCTPLPQDPPTIVSLPHLRRISLFISRSIWLIYHIIVPPECLVRLDEITLEDTSLLPHLPLCQQLQSAQLTRLRVYAKSTSPLIQGWTNEFCIELAGPTSESGLFLSISAPSATSRERLAAALSNALLANPLFAHVSVLWAIRQPTSFVLTPAVLRALPALTMLGVVFDDRLRIADLGDVLSAKDGAADATLCPALAALCVQNCKAGEGGMDHVRHIVESRARAGGRRRIRYLAVECHESLHSQALALHAQALSLRSSVDDLLVRSRQPADAEAKPPREWGSYLDCADNGVWPDWTYFVHPGQGTTL
ncbi:hypothetical protein C8Q80DRAFT_1266173 [Daedaleopsis nitida]|nr:hypothetical protein C8Q80DRAFT_1266173 [Daedaleopsis nitida]